MKKLLLVLFAGVMVMAMAATASAEITVGGEIEVRYDLWDNLQLSHGTTTNMTQTFFDERVILNVDAKITEGLEAFVELDTENQNWGLAPSPVLATLPAYLNHEDGPMFVRQAWINFMIPGLPVGMKIGHQPLALGHGIWLDTHRAGSDAILVYSKPMPELLIAGAYVRGSQNVASTPANFGAFNRLNPAFGGTAVLTNFQAKAFDNEANFYAVLANYTFMEGNTVGLNFTYVNDNNSLPVAGFKGAAIHAYNTELVLDGNVAGVTYKGEVNWLYVNTANVGSILKGLPATGQDYIVSAWAAMLGASYKIGNVATVGMEVAYGTGNDDNQLNGFYNPGGAAFSTATGPKFHDSAYYTPYNSTSYNYAFLYNDKIGQGPSGSGGGLGFGDGFGGFGLANTGYVKVSVGLTPMERLSAGMDFMYLRASETMIEGQSRDLGFEIDANVAYKIYDNLTLSLNAGVFNPGAWYAFAGHSPAGVANAKMLTDGTDPDSPLRRDVAWGMETKLSVKF